MAQYVDFIPENTAPADAKRIGVYRSDGTRLGVVPLGNLALPAIGRKQYSFGALSDVHITYDTATTDFQAALTYLNEDEDVAFTCICGDLTAIGSAEQLAQYKAVVDTYSPDTPVYAISGNHEGDANNGNGGIVTTATIRPYTGQPLYYSFTQGNDVFIMLGERTWWSEGLFEDGELQWLYETLEANRNKRCFVFFHVFPTSPWGDCGNACGIYASDIFSPESGSKKQQGPVFVSLLQHYKNTILFHGHSHLRFDLQEIDVKANYSNSCGYRSVHIPSLSVPRDGNESGSGSRTEVYSASEGYVVDVYENGVHLRGRDFVGETFLPIASYWLDTAPQTIPAKTYTDSHGIIDT